MRYLYYVPRFRIQSPWSSRRLLTLCSDWRTSLAHDPPFVFLSVPLVKYLISPLQLLKRPFAYSIRLAVVVKTTFKYVTIKIIVEITYLFVQSVIQFLSEYYSPSDLSSFLSQYDLPAPVSLNPKKVNVLSNCFRTWKWLALTNPTTLALNVCLR